MHLHAYRCISVIQNQNRFLKHCCYRPTCKHGSMMWHDEDLINKHQKRFFWSKNHWLTYPWIILVCNRFAFESALVQWGLIVQTNTMFTLDPVRAIKARLDLMRVIKARSMVSVDARVIRIRSLNPMCLSGKVKPSSDLTRATGT